MIKHKKQQGFAHIQLILLGGIVLGLVGFTGWRIMSMNKESDSKLDKLSAQSEADATLAKEASLKAKSTPSPIEVNVPASAESKSTVPTSTSIMPAPS